MDHELFLATSEPPELERPLWPRGGIELYAGTTPDGALRNHSRQCRSWPITFQRIRTDHFDTSKDPALFFTGPPGTDGLIGDHEVLEDLPLTDLFGSRYPDLDACLNAFARITSDVAAVFFESRELVHLRLDAGRAAYDHDRGSVSHCAEEAFFKYFPALGGRAFDLGQDRVRGVISGDWYQWRALPVALAAADLLDEQQSTVMDTYLNFLVGGR